MNGFILFFIALTLLNAWRFHKSRDPWFLALCLLFALSTVRVRLPEVVFNSLLVPLVVWLVWLAAFKFIPSLRMRHLMGNPKLVALTSEERKWRGTLDADERRSLEMWEMLTKKRFSTVEAIEFLERHRQLEAENEASRAKEAAEQEVERAKEQAIEDEKREMQVVAVSSPLEVVMTDQSRFWLKLDPIEYREDDDYGAPVRCTVWSTPPEAGGAGASSVLGLAEAVSFQAAETVDGKPEFWASRSAEFKKMFRKRCLIADVGMADDGRERFNYQIGEKKFVIMTKYLFWRTDLALDDDRQRVWVRVSGLLSEVWNGDLEAESESAEFEDFEMIPAFVFPISIDQLMPSVNPDAHFLSVEAMFE